MSLYTVILAAGQGRRFKGGPKPLASLGDTNLITYAIEHASQLTPEKVLVILGYRAEEVTQGISDFQCIAASSPKIVHHREWVNGMGSSIAKGVKSLPADATAVLILLCDQAAIALEELQGLLSLYRIQEQNKGKPSIVCANYRGSEHEDIPAKVGAPAIFPQRYFEQLMALSGDKGAQELLRKETTVAVPMASAKRDIDTLDDLHRLHQLGHKNTTTHSKN